ncbi:MAG: ribosome-associated heat shock protein Hsp15 [Planctomycetota bacterium]|jgi:ribosome-associated heat shock protein Hsp15|uniref:RNA-binding S4 domain-containing protein n=1 Tax=Patiriisocius sp. Uisw_047 TaxID=3230969 RepID=UPI0039EA95F0
MRVDKYLWCIRYCKTRSVATKECKKGAVRLGDAVIKPSRDVFPGDTITYRKKQVSYVIQVINLPEQRVGAKLVALYAKDVTPKEAFQQQALLKYSKDYYRKKGVGRPTKKDRRDIDGFYVDTEEE